jgi:hypothetical protein
MSDFQGDRCSLGPGTYHEGPMFRILYYWGSILPAHIKQVCGCEQWAAVQKFLGKGSYGSRTELLPTHRRGVSPPKKQQTDKDVTARRV